MTPLVLCGSRAELESALEMVRWAERLSRPLVAVPSGRHHSGTLAVPLRPSTPGLLLPRLRARVPRFRCQWGTVSVYDGTFGKNDAPRGVIGLRARRMLAIRHRPPRPSDGGVTVIRQALGETLGWLETALADPTSLDDAARVVRVAHRILLADAVSGTGPAYAHADLRSPLGPPFIVNDPHEVGPLPASPRAVAALAALPPLVEATFKTCSEHDGHREASITGPVIATTLDGLDAVARLRAHADADEFARIGTLEDALRLQDRR